MSDLNNIDKILKDSFADFTPDAPDVWQGIEQGVQAAQAGQVAGTTAVVKGTSLVVKIIATVAISASVVTGYILLTQTSETATPDTTEAVTTSKVEETPAIISEPQGTTTPAQETPATEKAGKVSSSSNNYRVVSQAAHAEVDLPPTPPQPLVMGLKEQLQQGLKTPEKAVVAGNTPPVERVKETPEETDQDDDQQTETPVATEREEYGEVIVPNTFTPNGDGRNDKYVILIENEQFYSLTIMDRNGKEVFESTDKNNQWDGKDYKTGAVCPAGTYYRVFRYQLKGAQSESKTTGIIVLIN